MYFIRSYLQHLLLTKISKDNWVFKSHPETENKNYSISINLLCKIKCITFTIVTKINENNDVF